MPKLFFRKPKADPARQRYPEAMAGLVERTLDLHRKLAAPSAVPHVKAVLQRHAEGGGHGPGDRPAGV